MPRTTPDFHSFFGKKPRFDLATYLWAHAKTPNEVIEILKRTLEKVGKNPEFDNDLKKVGYRARYVDGDIFMKEELPESIKFIKEILTEIGLMK